MLSLLVTKNGHLKSLITDILRTWFRLVRWLPLMNWNKSSSVASIILGCTTLYCYFWAQRACSASFLIVESIKSMDWLADFLLAPHKHKQHLNKNNQWLFVSRWFWTPWIKLKRLLILEYLILLMIWIWSSSHTGIETSWQPLGKHLSLGENI